MEIGMSQKTIVMWTIHCFDKRKKNPLPLTNRTFCLDWSKVSDDAAKDTLSILKDSEPPVPRSAPNIGDTTETLSYSSQKPDRRMLKYRHLFIETEPQDIQKRLNDPNSQVKSVRGIYIPKYFEDENGAPITMTDIMKYVTGEENPIINTESILRIGPVDQKNQSDWTIDKANTIAHFFEIIKLIYNSNWQKSPLSITSTALDSNKPQIVQPRVESTCSILLFFRQLYSTKDKLFENACEYYIEHASNDLKIAWVKERKNAFYALLNNAPFPFQITEYSTKEFIDVFLYGSGLIHPIGNNLRAQNKLKGLIKKYGKEKVAFTIHSCFRQLLGYAIDIYHVIKQDFDYWVKKKGYSGPHVVDVYELFRSDLNNK